MLWCCSLLYRVGQESLYTKQCVSHTDNTAKFPGYGSHVRTIFDTVVTLPLYVLVCAVWTSVTLGRVFFWCTLTSRPFCILYLEDGSSRFRHNVDKFKSSIRPYFFCVDSLTFHIYTISHRVVLDRILKLAVSVVDSSSEAVKTKV